MVNYVCDICGKSTGENRKNLFNFKRKRVSIIYHQSYETCPASKAPDICAECLNKIEGFIDSLVWAANEKTETESEGLK